MNSEENEKIQIAVRKLIKTLQQHEIDFIFRYGFDSWCSNHGSNNKIAYFCKQNNLNFKSDGEAIRLEIEKQIEKIKAKSN